LPYTTLFRSYCPVWSTKPYTATAIGRVGAGSWLSRTWVWVLSGMNASGRVSGNAVRPLSVTVAQPPSAAASRQAQAIREIIGADTSVHFDERRDDDLGHLAGLIVGDGQGDLGQAANEVDRLAAKADRSPFLRIVAENGVDDLRG